MLSRPRTFTSIALVLIGVLLWIEHTHFANSLIEVGALKHFTPLHFGVLVSAVALASISQCRQRILDRLNRIQHPSPRSARFTAVGVFVLSIAYIGFTAWMQNRDLIPKFHDEHLLLVQARLLSQFRLWAPAHPLADFFESFHIFVKPRYASVYFPGSALLYVWGIWLHLRFWMLPLLIAGLCAGFTYRVVAELLDDGVAGLLAAFMLVSLQWFRYLAMMVMSQNVLMLGGLLLIFSWLRWRRDKKLPWAVAIGAYAGWMAIRAPLMRWPTRSPSALQCYLIFAPLLAPPRPCNARRGLPLRRALLHLANH